MLPIGGDRLGGSGVLPKQGVLLGDRRVSANYESGNVMSEHAYYASLKRASAPIGVF